MKIKILGTGCARCQQLEKTTREVVKELGIDADNRRCKGHKEDNGISYPDYARLSD